MRLCIVAAAVAELRSAAKLGARKTKVFWFFFSKKNRKNFFFEKKKQKTFVCFGSAWGGFALPTRGGKDAGRWRAWHG
jgi:hypothetical protein